MSNKPRVAIMMSVYNRLLYAQLALKYFMRYESYPVELHIFDNNSTTYNMQEWLLWAKQSYNSDRLKIYVHLLGENCGLGWCFTEFTKMIDTDYFGILGEDCIITSSYIQEFITAMNKNPDIGVLGLVNMGLLLNIEGRVIYDYSTGTESEEGLPLDDIIIGHKMRIACGMGVSEQDYRCVDYVVRPQMMLSMLCSLLPIKIRDLGIKYPHHKGLGIFGADYYIRDIRDGLTVADSPTPTKPFIGPKGYIAAYYGYRMGNPNSHLFCFHSGAAESSLSLTNEFTEPSPICIRTPYLDHARKIWELHHWGQKMTCPF